MKIFEASIGSEQILVCQYGPVRWEEKKKH